METKKISTWMVGFITVLGINAVYAAIIIPMYLTDANGQGKSIGTVKAEEAACGVLFTPDLHDLPPGVHGFHVHENPSCGDKGMAAGGHLDPGHTEHHDGPYNEQGHLGDLPVLIVDKEGRATTPTEAPKLKLSMLPGHSLMIHAGGDNYSDTPEKLGGGGARIACGVIS